MISSPEQPNLPSFNESILKKYKSIAKLGLSFGVVDGVVVLSKVWGSAKKKTQLVRGLKVLEINNTPITNTQQAESLIEEVIVGEEVIVKVQGSVYTATRSLNRFSFSSSTSLDDKIGISIWEDPSYIGDSEFGDFIPRIIITDVDANGLFPSIPPNSILHAVNQQVVSNFHKTLDILRNSRTLTLIVLNPHYSNALSQQEDVAMEEVGPGNSQIKLDVSDDAIEMEPVEHATTNEEEEEKDYGGDEYRVRVVACVIRRKDDDIGITLEETSGGFLTIASVDPDGVFADTGLARGQQLVKINGHVWSRISEEKLNKANELLQQANGRITLEAATTKDTTVERQIFSIQKTSFKFSLGLGIKAESSQLTITQTTPSIEKVLGIKEGLYLCKINNVPVHTLKMAKELMEEAFPILSLECIAHQATQNLTDEEEEATTELSSKQQKEHQLAIRALPVSVDASNKQTAKIVKTTVVPCSPSEEALGLVLAKHYDLNAIVVTDIHPSSQCYGLITTGQILVSINHITCPITTYQTYKALQQNASKELRLEVGDVEHVTNGEYQDKDDSPIVQAIQMGIEKATSEIIDDVPDVPHIIEEDEAPEDEGQVEISFDEGVELPKEDYLKKSEKSNHVEGSKNDSSLKHATKEIGLIPTHPPVTEREEVVFPKAGCESDQCETPGLSDCDKDAPSNKENKENATPIRSNLGVDRRATYGTQKSNSTLSTSTKRGNQGLLSETGEKSNSIPHPRDSFGEMTKEVLSSTPKQQQGLQWGRSNREQLRYLASSPEVLGHLQSQLQEAQQAKQRAETNENETRRSLNAKLESLQQQLAAANDATITAEDKVVRSIEDQELFKAKEDAEKNVKELTAKLEEANASLLNQKHKIDQFGQKLKDNIKHAVDTKIQAEEEALKAKQEFDSRLRSAIDEKEKAEEEALSHKKQVETVIKEKGTIETELKEAKQRLEILEAKLETTKEEEREIMKQEILEKDEKIAFLLRIQQEHKDEVEILTKKLQATESTSQLTMEEMLRLKTLENKMLQIQKDAAEVAKLGEEVISLRSSLKEAEEYSQMSMKELSALKTESAARLHEEIVARRKAETEISRLKVEIEKAMRSKALLEKTREEVATANLQLETFKKLRQEYTEKEEKNMKLAEKARTKTEKDAQTFGTAEEKRVKAKEVTKMNRIWKLFAFTVILMTYLYLKDEKLTILKSMSFGAESTMMNVVRVLQNNEANTRQSKSEEKLNSLEEARVKRETKDAERRLKREAKAKAKAEREAAKKSKREAELKVREEARQKAADDKAAKKKAALQAKHAAKQKVADEKLAKAKAKADKLAAKKAKKEADLRAKAEAREKAAIQKKEWV